MIATAAMLAARGSRYGDFIAGVLIGVGVGFLLRPAVWSWLAWKQWTEVSREARLTDEVLARMEHDSAFSEEAELNEPFRPCSEPR